MHSREGPDRSERDVESAGSRTPPSGSCAYLYPGLPAGRGGRRAAAILMAWGAAVILSHTGIDLGKALPFYQASA